MCCVSSVLMLVLVLLSMDPSIDRCSMRYDPISCQRVRWNRLDAHGWTDKQRWRPQTSTNRKENRGQQRAQRSRVSRERIISVVRFSLCARCRHGILPVISGICVHVSVRVLFHSSCFLSLIPLLLSLFLSFAFPFSMFFIYFFILFYDIDASSRPSTLRN